MQVQEYEKDGYSEMQRKNDVECEGQEQKLFQIRMELGEEIERGHFDYGCSPKFKKERLLLNASQNLRMELGEEIERGHFDYGCSPKFKKESYERAQGREMYHYKRRKGRAHQDSMQEDEKDGMG
ncbi:unnamed protein product [Brassica rapa subsp. narinosa]